jgi:signal transduction histidine kinase
MTLGLVASLMTVIAGEFASPWFLRAIVVVILALVALVLQRVSQFVVASYALVLELLAFVMVILLQTGTTSSTVLYLFIPIVMIAGLILPPLGIIMTAALSISMLVAAALLKGQFFSANIHLLLLPVTLIIVTGLLAAESGRSLPFLGRRLLENRDLLRSRTRELLGVQQELEQLTRKAVELEQQLLYALTETNRKSKAPENQLYSLITGTIQELDGALKTLRSVIEQLGEGPAVDKHTHLLEEAWQKIHYLARLVVHLEELAEIESGTLQLNCQPVEPVRLLTEVTGIAQGMAREKEIKVVYQGPSELPLIHGDPTRLRQALLQVLANSVKYTDQGTVEIQAEVNNGELLIFVSDTGIGMYPDERQKVFEKFSRGSGTLARQRQGTGLGLSISKGLVELHGGHMWATSALGVGSTFYLALPINPPEELTVISQPARGPLVATLRTPVLKEIEQADETQLILRPPLTAQSSLGPVSRFSPAYVSRFAIALLVLLLLIAALAGVLALSNGTVQENGAATGEISSTVPAVAADAPSSTPTPPDFTMTARSTMASPAVTRTPGRAVRLTVTPTPPPTATAQPLIIPVPLVTASPLPQRTVPVPTATPTPIMLPVTALPSPSATPTAPVPTATPTFTMTPQPSPTLTSRATVAPTPTLTQPAASTVQPVREPGLAYIANQRVILSRFAASFGLNVNLVEYGGLSWSPDGRTLLFTTSGNGGLDLYVVDVSCAGLTKTCNRQPAALTQAAGDDVQPAWSPDGQRVAFSSGRHGNFDIYVMDATCLNQPEGCQDEPVRLTDSQGYEEWPAWSPNGQRIAFVSDQDGDVEIYTMNVDGSNQQQFTHNPSADWPVSWSPDGRWLLFASDRDGNWNLYLVEAISGSQPIRLTNDPADEREPIWSPDGQTIAFAANASGNWDIYTLPAFSAGRPVERPRSAWIQITDTPTDEHYPVWVP